MSLPVVSIWKEAPFIRIIIPLITGILIEWHFPMPEIIYGILIPVCLMLVILFAYSGSFFQFKYYWLTGLLITVLFSQMGGVITYYNDLRNHSNSITRLLQPRTTYIVTLDEPLSKKNNSFKANARFRQVYFNDSLKQVKGKVIIYFQKDSSLKSLNYNSRLVFVKEPQPVKNSGNPGAFDYKRYCIFQNIYYQVYLKPGDFKLLPVISDHDNKKWLFSTRKKIVTILRTYIHGEKEAGLAEALLIGYKDDLDKNLVQSYSNTGVVHIIAISGLHLGLIYWLLNLLLRPLPFKGSLRWIKVMLVITGLWVFSFIAGGSASVCRSAVMFSFIVIGEGIGRKTNIYNSLAASSFLLLCYNPFWLWDAGFQLSYVAVLSIVIFMKPVYNWFYIKNKLLDVTWKMAAISIAAQILTTPISIYNFHQFPNYFLITNLAAVPLSSLIVLAELALCVAAVSPYLASEAGGTVSWLIKLMNGFIEHMNKMPFSITDQLQLSFSQLLLTYLAIFATCLWLFQKNKKALIIALGCSCCFCILKSYSLIRSSSQYKLIVYNIPHMQGIDLIKGRHCLFLGDSSLQNNDRLQQFHLNPSRLIYRITDVRALQAFNNNYKAFSAGKRNVLIINGHTLLQPITFRYQAGIIILSGNPSLSIYDVQKIADCRILIFDSSNPEWKVRKWKADCEKAGIPYYSVAEKGAFILNMN